MSLEFVKQKIGSQSIAKARLQQSQLNYFTQSSIQESITQEYLQQYVERNYSGSDHFLNWVKAVFKTDNFLSFYKHFRAPLASARLINDKVKPQLERVFFSENSFFKYTVGGEAIEDPEILDSKEFNEWIFNALLFRFNDILVTDLKEVNTPFRQIVSIDNVVAILSERSIIHKIAYSASVPFPKEDGTIELVHGILYIDDKEYIFYDKELKEALLTVPHDLGECPADYISNEPFSIENDTVRRSIFTYVREEMEEYVFLKTLQRMTEPNGSIPITVQLKTKEQKKGEEDVATHVNGAPTTVNEIMGQQAEITKETATSGTLLEAGTLVKVKPPKKEGGGPDMDMIQNFFKFFYLPVEAMTYLDGRIKDLKANILSTLIGDTEEHNKEAKNEMQVRTGVISAEDRLRNISKSLSRIRQRSDFKMLALAHGRDRVTNQAFYGSDFFLETPEQLYNLFDKSPNTIERKNILVKISRNRNRFNKEMSEREGILYDLLPYISDKDFDTAINKQAVDDVTFQYQTRFPYWIGVFEAKFCDLLLFWQGLGEASNSEKLILINNLIINTIKAVLPPKPAVEKGEQT